MNYAYRWQYSFIIILLISSLAYFADLRLLYDQVNHLHAEEKKLREALTSKPQSNSLVKSSTLIKPRNTLSQLMIGIGMSGLSMQAIDISVLQQDGWREVKLNMQGRFQQLLNFFSIISKNAMPIRIQNFSSKWMQKEQILFSIDVLLRDLMQEKLMQLVMEQTEINPFCRQRILSAPSDVHRESLYSLKMLGFMQQGKHHRALLQLPDHHVISVKEGEILGKEGAQIIKIERNYLKVRLPNHEIWLIQREFQS